jgi:hypothetical protein
MNDQLNGIWKDGEREIEFSSTLYLIHFLFLQSRCNYVTLVKCFIEILDKWTWTLYELKDNVVTINNEQCQHLRELDKCIQVWQEGREIGPTRNIWDTIKDESKLAQIRWHLGGKEMGQEYTYRGRDPILSGFGQNYPLKQKKLPSPSLNGSLLLFLLMPPIFLSTQNFLLPMPFMLFSLLGCFPIFRLSQIGPFCAIPSFLSFGCFRLFIWPRLSPSPHQAHLHFWPKSKWPKIFEAKWANVQ